MAMEEQDCDISVCMCYVLWGRTTDNLLETFNDKEGAATLICFYFVYFFLQFRPKIEFKNYSDHTFPRTFVRYNIHMQH